jgi:flagellin
LPTRHDSSIDVISEIKAKLVAAREPGVDKTKIDKELTELKNQLVSISESASFSGENWLNNSWHGCGRQQGNRWRLQPRRQRPGFDHHPGHQRHQTTMIGAANETLGILTKDIDANALDPNATGTARNYYLIDTGATTATAASGTALHWLRPPPTHRSMT